MKSKVLIVFFLLCSCILDLFSQGIPEIKPIPLPHKSAYYQGPANSINSDSLTLFDVFSYKKPLNTNFKRFTYSQFILWNSSIASYFYLYLNTKDKVDWSKKFKWYYVQKSFTEPPMWDEDHWSYNYMVHPIMGSFSYLAYRNHGASWYTSLGGTILNSFIHEYLIASFTQPASAVDLISTPFGGFVLGESIYQIKKEFMSDHYLSTLEKIIITILDPFDALYYRFNYRAMLRN